MVLTISGFDRANPNPIYLTAYKNKWHVFSEKDPTAILTGNQRF